MEVERQRYIQEAHYGTDGKIKSVGPDRPVGKPERFEFGNPSDEIAAIVGGGFQSLWNSDFLQKELGSEGTCARFFFDKRFVVDIANPNSDLIKRKRKLCFKNGFGYLCIPVGFQKNTEKLRELYNSALQEYQQYEKAHPRPAVLQETLIVDEKGNTRRALLTAMDVKVGGGIVGNVEKQQQELREASKLSSKELKRLKNNSKLHRKIRESLQSGTPFRNPFVGPGKRKYAVEYGH